jgi:hypothetical protein
VIDDKDFEEMLQAENAFAAIRPLALMVAGYYQVLRASGMPHVGALALTREFQMMLLTRQFAQIAKDA